MEKYGTGAEELGKETKGFEDIKAAEEGNKKANKQDKEESNADAGSTAE